MPEQSEAFLSPDEYGARFMWDLTLDDLGRGRSQQTDNRQLGMSDIGSCREYVRRFLLNDPFTDAPDRLPAMIGTWVDGAVKAARVAANPGLIVDAEVHLTLDLPDFPGLRLTGHPDEIDPSEPSVTDLKTKDADGFVYVRKHGATQQQRYQRHLYYAACVEAGLLPPDGVVRNIFLDRSGKHTQPYVEQEPFAPQVVAEATDWLASVLYGIQHTPDEVLTRDTPEPVCRRFCAFYTACRGGTWAGDLEPNQLPAARRYLEAQEQIKEWTPIMAAARSELEGSSGTLDGITVRSTAMNPVGKRPYTRVEVSAA